MQKFICLCFAVTVLAVGNTGMLQQVQARWKPEYADAPHREWFAQQRNKFGSACCDYADAHAVYDAYIKDGKWHVPIDGTIYEIQPHQLLNGPNPTGHAVIWYFRYYFIQKIDIYCFSPGPLY
jgi:hypothetical protein